MIAASPLAGQSESWQAALRDAVVDPAELVAALGLDPALGAAASEADRRFALRVPRSFLARMRRGDPADPLLRQVLPTPEELREVPGYDADPVGDLASAAGPGLLRKYHGRALLLATGACAIHCRYCFRREFPYAGQLAAGSRLAAALDAIAADASLTEVILSGGDPLSLSNARLGDLTARLESIGHLRRLRIHTRHPIVLPERVDAGLLAWLAALRLPTVMVVHANHATEIDASVTAALRAIAAQGVVLLNQSVLLRGVNDSAGSLQALSEALSAARVVPYYLHLLDPVRGASHFEVGEDEGRSLVETLRTRLPGYLVPRLVRETAGRHSKTPVA